MHKDKNKNKKEEKKWRDKKEIKQLFSLGFSLGLWLPWTPCQCPSLAGGTLAFLGGIQWDEGGFAHIFSLPPSPHTHLLCPEAEVGGQMVGTPVSAHCLAEQARKADRGC